MTAKPENQGEGITFGVKNITLVEVGVIVSLIASIGTGVFTMGVLYGEVRENTRFRSASAQTQVEMREDIADIKANVNFLTEQAREQRQRNYRP
jgi:hypothetical protein